MSDDETLFDVPLFSAFTAAYETIFKGTNGRKLRSNMTAYFRKALEYEISTYEPDTKSPQNSAHALRSYLQSHGVEASITHDDSTVRVEFTTDIFSGITQKVAKLRVEKIYMSVLVKGLLGENWVHRTEYKKGDTIGHIITKKRGRRTE